MVIFSHVLYWSALSRQVILTLLTEHDVQLRYKNLIQNLAEKCRYIRSLAFEEKFTLALNFKPFCFQSKDYGLKFVRASSKEISSKLLLFQISFN